MYKSVTTIKNELEASLSKYKDRLASFDLINSKDFINDVTKYNLVKHKISSINFKLINIQKHEPLLGYSDNINVKETLKRK